MLYYDTSHEIIMSGFGFEGDNICYKKLNVEKLLKSDFIDRFIGFVEEYDEVFNKNVFDSAQKWLEYGKEEYDCIKYFLNVSPIETQIPLTIYDFISMSPNDCIAFQEKCAKICALIDEKRALYEEFNTFYE